MNFIPAAFMIYVIACIYLIYLSYQDHVNKSNAITSETSGTLRTVPVGYINYNYPKSMKVEEITLVITKSGNLKIKVTVENNKEDYGPYIEMILVDSILNKYRDTDDTYIVDISRKDAKIISEDIIKMYYKYTGRVYYQEVNVISDIDNNETLDYTYISRSSFDMRI